MLLFLASRRTRWRESKQKVSCNSGSSLWLRHLSNTGSEYRHDNGRGRSRWMICQPCWLTFWITLFTYWTIAKWLSYNVYGSLSPSNNHIYLFSPCVSYRVTDSSQTQLWVITAWIRCSVYVLSQRRPLFNPRSIHAGFLLDGITLAKLSSSTSVFPFWYNSTRTSYSFIYHRLYVYTPSNW